MYVDLKRNEDIVQCPACNRILYFEPPVPVALQHP
jgi:predicted  nucleic acid-binding Zn-ribbon protein